MENSAKVTYSIYVEEDGASWELVYDNLDSVEDAIDFAEGEWNAYYEAEWGNINEDETVFYYDAKDFDENGCVGKIVTEDGDVVRYYIVAKENN